MKNIKADIRNNTYKTVYLLFGEEVYLMRKCLQSLKKAIAGDGESDVNYAHFDGSTGYDVNEVKEIAVTLPFFADRRLIVIENSGLFGSNDQGIADFLAEIPESTVLVLAEGSVDKRTRLYKEIKKVGYAAEFTTPTPDQTAEFAAGYLGQAGKRITVNDCKYFVDSVGGDLYNITTELEKIIAYSGTRDTVTRSDIDAVCSMQIEGRIFDIVDKLMESKRNEAMNIYFDLIALRESPLGILRFITRQYNRLLVVRDEIDRGSSDAEIASKAHMPDWVARKTRAQLKGRKRRILLDAVTLCTDTEEAIKTGDISEEKGLEILLANLAAL